MRGRLIPVLLAVAAVAAGFAYAPSADGVAHFGASGGAGERGPAGPTGATGATGAAGATGATGAAGSTGATGPEGAKGTTGTTGATGAEGPKGTTGTTGSTGPEGATGAKGEGEWLGAYSAATTYAKGAIVSELGSSFISLKGSNKAHTPTALGEWWAVVAEKGATGPEGATGATGAAGATGATGPTGATGSTGATGATGPAGKVEVESVTYNAGVTGNEEHEASSTKIAFVTFTVALKKEVTEAATVTVKVNKSTCTTQVFNDPSTVSPILSAGCWVPAGQKYEVAFSATKGALEGLPKVTTVLFK